MSDQTQTPGDGGTPTFPEHIAKLEGLTDAERAAIHRAEQRGIKFTLNGQVLDNPSPDQGDPAPTARAQRPEHIPEKFWDASTGQVRIDDFAKAYGELERKLSSREPADPPAPNEGGEGQGEGDGGTPSPALGEAINSAVEAYSQSGEVTEELVAGLEAAGLPRENVALYFQGLQAIAELARVRAHAAVGGAENWNAMTEWARTNLSEAEQAAFDEMVVDPSKSDFAIQGLWNRYVAAEGGPSGRFVTRDSAPGAPSGDVYTGRAEMFADMRDPRYKTDPGFREQVAAKIARSEAAGTLSIHAVQRAHRPR